MEYKAFEKSKIRASFVNSEIQPVGDQSIKRMYSKVQESHQNRPPRNYSSKQIS